MISQRKGQVTMETILIYGIVAIVAISGIGALIYFGVLDMEKYLPDKCTVNNLDLECAQWSMKSGALATNTLSIGLGFKNNNKYPILISEINLSTADGSALLADDAATGLTTCVASKSVIINPNSVTGIQLFNGTANDGCVVDSQKTSKGDKIKLNMIISYTRQIPSGTAVERKATGEVLATIS